MPTNTDALRKAALLRVGKSHILAATPDTLIMPDPKVKDARCQERAIYYAFLRQKYNEDPASLTDEELTDIGAGVMLTLNIDHKADGFGIVYEEFLLDKGADIRLPVPLTEEEVGGIKQKGKLVLFARQQIAQSASRFVREQGSVDARAFLDGDGRPFALGGAGGLSINPFFPDGVAIMSIAFRENIPVAIQSVLLQENDKGLQKQVRADLLVFMPEKDGQGVGRFRPIDYKALPAKSPVLVVKGVQVDNGQEFVDDIQALREGKVALSDIVLSQYAVHYQLTGKSTALTFCEQGFSEGKDTLAQQEPASPFSILLGRPLDPRALFPGMYLRGLFKKLKGVVSSADYKRASGRVDFCIEHIAEMSLGSLQIMHDCVGKACGKVLPQQMDEGEGMALPDGVFFMKDYQATLAKTGPSMQANPEAGQKNKSKVGV